MVGGIGGTQMHERPILPENNFPFQEERWEGVVLPCLTKHFQERESIMFEYCPMINMKCAFCGTQKKEKHCGIQKGKIDQTKIRNMKKCPRKNSK